MTTEAWLILLSSVILVLMTGGGLWLRYVADQLKSKDTAIQALKGVVKLKDAQIASLQGDTPTITKAYTTMRDNIEQVTQEGQPLTEQLADLTSEQQLSKHLLPAKETDRASGVWSRFKPATTRQGKIALGIFGTIVLIVVCIVVRVVSQADAEHQADHALPSEQLQIARGFCPLTPNSAVACSDSEMVNALHHLDLIPSSAPEFNEASKLRSPIQAFRIKVVTVRQKVEEDQDALLAKAERDRLKHQSVED